jgi:hypothetical protein
MKLSIVMTSYDQKPFVRKSPVSIFKQNWNKVIDLRQFVCDLCGEGFRPAACESACVDIIQKMIGSRLKRRILEMLKSWRSFHLCSHECHH